jgi:Flp pilus assembly protein TadD
MVCHRPNGAGPFPLTEYKFAKKRASQIAGVTRSGFMPPWLPVAGVVSFSGARGLTDEERRTIAAWAQAGAPQGDPTIKMSPLNGSEGWVLGKPDLLLTLAEPFTLPAGGPDIYRNFVIRSPVDRFRWVRALEFKPSNRKRIHHARMAVDSTAQSRRSDESDPGPGFASMDLGAAVNPDGHLLGWAPGRLPSPEDDGMAWPLAPGTDLVVQLHMVPSGKPEPVDVQIGLYFSDEPPNRRPATVVLGGRDIDIAPGEREFVVEDRYVLPVDVEATAVLPHAHYIAMKMQIQATRPDGDRLWLLRIDDWDFNWQDEYRFDPPIALPAGTVIDLRYTYDNSADNPQNPFHPPQTIRHGPQTTDEMAEAVLQFLPVNEKDVAVIDRDYRRQLAENAVAFRRRIRREHPGDAWNLAALGSGLLELQRFEAAIDVLTDAARLLPKDEKIRNNLGYALLQAGRSEAAIAQFRHGLQQYPQSIGLHSNIGQALRRLGHWTEALPHLRIAADARPDDLVLATDLAWLLATHPETDLRDGPSAVGLARKAVNAAPGDAIRRTTLAAALAAAGDFPSAIQQALQARKTADSPDQEGVRRQIERQLASYRQEKLWLQAGVR